MKPNMDSTRAQASYEMVLVAVIVVVLAVSVLAHFAPLTESVFGIAAAREGAIKSLSNEEKAYLVQRVDFDGPPGTGSIYRFRIFTQPLEDNFTSSNFEIGYICESVNKAVGWNTTNIEVAFNNSGAISCHSLQPS